MLISATPARCVGGRVAAPLRSLMADAPWDTDGHAHAQAAQEVSGILPGLLDVLRASVPLVPEGSSIDLAPEQRELAEAAGPCLHAVALLHGFIVCSDATAAALLCGAEEGAALSRAAVALLRSVPAAPGGTFDSLSPVVLSACDILRLQLERCGAPSAAAAAAPGPARLFAALDASAAALAGAVAAACAAVGTDAAAGAGGCESPVMRGMLVEQPMACLELLYASAALAAGPSRPLRLVTPATTRAMMGAAAGAVALVPPGANKDHWACRAGASGHDFLVRGAEPCAGPGVVRGPACWRAPAACPAAPRAFPACSAGSKQYPFPAHPSNPRRLMACSEATR